jgi:8-oxo-dGTP diphosphatase
VLLQLRENTGYRDGHWAVGAAGHVQPGESVVEAAVREAREELEVGIAQDDLLPVCAMHRTHGNHRAIDERVDFFFTCSRWSGEPRRVEVHKSGDLRWFRLDALPEPVVPHERAVLDALRAGPVPAILTYGFA